MGVYKSDSWTKASVFNPLTGDVALMTTLIGGETFLAPQEEITQETTNGNYISQWRHRVQFACSDWDAFDTLQGFKDDHIAVQAVAAAEALNCANLQWYESVQIKELRKVPKPRRADGDSHFIVVLEFEGDENAAIFNNVNLLHQTNVNGVVVTGFVDGDADGLADGWTKNGSGYVATFTAGIQKIDTEGSAVQPGLLRTVVFPGIVSEFVFSIITQEKMATTEFIEIEINSFSGSISSATKSIGTSSSGAIVPVEEESTSSIHSLIVYMQRRDSGSASGISRVEKPCLRTDGSTEYIAG